MGTQLRELRPREVWEDAELRSIAAGVAGFFIVGAFQAGAVPIAHRGTLAPASGMVSAFLMTLTLLIAYYHKNWKFGIAGGVLGLILPFSVNLLWVKLSHFSLIYPTIALVVLGVTTVQLVHRSVSGPLLEDDVEEALIEAFIENMDSNFTWKDRVIWLCFTGGVIVLLILLTR
jgi:hypothetical protein